MPKIRSLFVTASLALACGGGLTSVANANPTFGTISYSIWYPGTGSNASGAPSGTPTDGMVTTPWSGDSTGNLILVPQFAPNASLVLTDISISLSAQIDATLSAKNLAAAGSSPAKFGSAPSIFHPIASPWSYNLNISVLAPGGSTGADALATASPVATSLTGYSLPAHTTSFVQLGSVVNSTALSSTLTMTDPAILALFQGNGTVDLPLLTSSLISGPCSNCDNISYSLSTFAAADVIVTYDYEIPAPEPASIALLGSALIGAGAIRRRRSRKF